MGNESCSFPRIISKDIEVPQLKQRNSYGYSQHNPDEKVLKQIFSQSYEQNRKSKVLQLIQQNRDQLFQDEKFKLNEKESLRLAVLFNFQTNRTRIYSKKEQTDITSFIQLNIEFSYLTSVFYLLCRKETKAKLLPRLIETQETNSYGAYSTELFCNGEKHQVIIDDRMPTHNDNFLFLRVVKGIELWPLILEKAWCKQVGSYERAKGLSPEDAFEEITGIPAYTYTIRANNHSNIKTIMNSAVGKGYWVALVARNGLNDLQNRQVFHLQSIDGDQYRIISPYVSYSFERYPQRRRGEVIVKEQDIFSHFQHIIVGFYKENYVPISVPVSSKARQELLFELTIRHAEEVSIRFNQLYNGYFGVSDRPNYEYSPVMIQLYQVNEENGVKNNCKIVNYCQGCNRSLSGARSVQCSANTMEVLEGKYIIRLQVGWNFENLLNTGNLVVYASEGNAFLTPLRNNELLFKEIYPDIFLHDGTNNITLFEHDLKVNTFDKEKSTLIMFHNVTSSVHHFQADFSRSKNVLLRGKEIKDQYAYIRLQPDEKTIIEVLPKNMKEHIQIQNFQINKVPIKV